MEFPAEERGDGCGGGGGIAHGCCRREIVRTEVGRKACEWRGRGRSWLLVLVGGSAMVLLLLLCHASPQLHAIPGQYKQVRLFKSLEIAGTRTHRAPSW